MNKNDQRPSDSFVVIDVEYSDREQNICQIGLVVVRNLETAEKKYWLIQPPDNHYDVMMTRVHNITPEDTENMPSFEQRWPEVQPYLLMGELWAHNAASAEMPAFRKSMGEYGIPCDWLDINDSIELFQRPDCNGGNGLTQCAMAMGVPFDEQQHHDALYDADILAEILIRYAQGFRPRWEGVPASNEQLRKAGQAKLTLRMGGFAAHQKLQDEQKKAGYVGEKIDLFAELSSSCAGAQPQTVDVFDIGDKMQKEGADLVDIARLDTSENNPLRGRVVAMTGAFHISRKEIERAMEAMGATTDGMTKNTDLLLVGNRNVGLPKLAKYEKQSQKRAVAIVVGDDDLDALLYGDGQKFFAQ